MATIKTRFDVGAHVVSLDKQTMKVREFDVGRISIYQDKDGNTGIWYHPMLKEGYPDYSGFPEDWCFPSTEDMMRNIMDDSE